MKKWNKVLSVGLSLVLCGSMIAPAFAYDLQQYIDEQVAAGNVQENLRFTDVEGSKTHARLGEEFITLKQLDDGDVYEVNSDITTKYTLRVTGDSDVTIDLNGNTIDHGGNKGSVLMVDHGGKLTVNDSSALNENGEYELGKGTGAITGGTGSAHWGRMGGGVSVLHKDSTFTMNGGSITGNKADGGAVYSGDKGSESPSGGGAYVSGGAILNLNGVTVSNNEAESGRLGYGGGGGGIGVAGSTANLTNVLFTGNKSAADGAAMSACDSAGIGTGTRSTVSMDGVTFIGNEAKGDAGAMNIFGSNLSMNNVTMTGNKAGNNGGAIWMGTYDGDKISFGENVLIAGNTANGAANDIQLSIIDHKETGTPAGELAGIATFTEYEGENLRRHEKLIDLNSYSALWDIVYSECEPGEPVQENVVDPQPGVPGSYDEVTRCTLCNDVLKTVHVIIPALPVDDDATGNTPDAPTPTPGGGPSEYYPAGTADPEAEVEDTGIEIEDEAVPLAGLFTRADAIGYLWEKAGKPDAELSDFPDVPEDHEWAMAIGWAQDMGIALADKDGNFRPDDLVLRSVESLEISPEGELQEFLNRYAVFAGIELDADELFIELEGSWDDVIMGEDAQVIFDDFFARLEEALADIAA